MADNFDNYSMKVQARVDLPSNKDIDAQIRKLEKSISKLKVSGQFDDTALRNLTNQLNTLKASITTANFSPTALTELTNQVNRALQNINIGNINVGNIGNQAQQVGQQIGQQINQGVSQSLSGNTGVLDTFRRSLENIGMGSEEIDAVANRIENLGVKIEALNQSTSHTVGRRGNRDILSVDISGTDRLGQAIKLTEQYNMATGDLIRSMDSVSTAQQKATANVSTFNDKLKIATADYENTLSKIESGINDKGVSKPIKDQNHIDALNTQIGEVNNAITNLGNASASTFTDMKIEVERQITLLQNMERAYRNAETVATSLRAKDIDTVKSQYASKLDVLTTKMKSSGVYTSGFQNGTNNLQNMLESASDSSGLVAFLNGLDKLEAGYKRAKASADAFNQSQKVGIKVSGLEASISDLQRISPEIDGFEANINGAKVTVQSLRDELSKVSTQSDFSVVNEKWKAFEKSAKSAGIAISEVDINLEKIQQSIVDGSYEAKVKNLVARTQEWTNANGDTRISVTALEKAYDNLINSKTDKDKIDNAKALDEAIKKTTNDVVKMNAEFAKDSKIASTHQRIQEFYDKNSASHRMWGKELQKMLKDTASGAELTNAELARIDDRFRKIGNEARQAGKLGLSFFDSVKEQGKKFIQWFSITDVIMETIQTMKKMASAVYEIDTAMTNLYKVTDETSQRYDRFLDSATGKAQELGRTVSSLVEQTANWSKLGFSLDEAEKLAEISSIYANVGEVDDDTAVSDMVTAMKAFNIEASDAITIVDMLNTLGNKYATSAADLGTGLSKSASAMATANTSIEKTLAMLTGGAEITQSADEFGNMLKVGSMRIRGMKGELEALGEEVDENVESISKMQTQVLNLTHGKVNIFNDNGEFKDYYDIMEGVAKIYSDLSSTEQASLSEILFGKQRGNQGAALIQAFQSGQIQKAYADIQDSAGSAYEEQVRWMESLEAKTAQFEAAFQSLSNTILDSDLLKGIVDFGTGTISVLDSVIDKFGTLPTLMATVGAGLGFKNIGRPKMFGLVLKYADNHMCSLGY